MTITLYDLVGSDASRPFSPHCWKTKMMFAHLGVDYESVPTRFTEIPNVLDGQFKTVPIIDGDGHCLNDSFAIAHEFAAGSPTAAEQIFGGQKSEAQVRMIEGWSQSQIHSWIAQWAMLDIFHMLDEPDQAYFRKVREPMFGKTLEKLTAEREESVPELVKRLVPLRYMLKHHAFIGGDEPGFGDFIVFGAFQWLRICSSLQMIPDDHPVMDWFKRCMDLHDGLGHTVSEGKLTI